MTFSELIDFFSQLHTVQGIQQLVKTVGLTALVIIIFAETGLLVGFFLPGDSLLVTAGVLSSSTLGGEAPLLNFYTLNLALMLAAIMGDQTGYFLGFKTGPRIFSKPDNRFFKKKYADQANAFYLKHGGMAIVLARFVPILRTFVPYIAGVAHMRYLSFARFSVIGGIVWIGSLTSLGHFIGLTPLGEKLHYVLLTVIALSVSPLLFKGLKIAYKKVFDPD